MTKGKYTPGPWVAMSEDPEFPNADGGCVVAHVYGCEEFVATVWGEMDTNLIAAAPDMLEVLKFLCDNYDVADVVDPIIAKATGDTK